MSKIAQTPTSDDTTVTHVSDETLREFVGYHLKRAFNVVVSDLNQTLKPYELRMITYTALILIIDNPGLRQSQLADALAIERPNLVVIIDELENRGLITRDRVPTDRRAYALNGTKAGEDLYKTAISAVHDHEKRVLGVLSDEERAAVIRAMDLIRRGPMED